MFLKRRADNRERLSESSHKLSQEGFHQDTWTGEGAWRIVHRIVGSIVLALGLVNISLGFFLAVLPLLVWVVWYIYMSLLVIGLIVMEIVALRHERESPTGGSLQRPEKREDPKGTSQTSLKYSDEPLQQQQLTALPSPRRNFGGILPLERPTHGTGNLGDDMVPLISHPNHQRPIRFGDVNASMNLSEYRISTRNRSRPGDVGRYVGLTPEQPLPINSLFIFSIVIDDRPNSNKANTISLELGSNKHLATPNSQYINSGQYSSSTIRSGKFSLYRRK
ncbi:unnamed protein product [Adineta steineri]|uniref:Uncharacterized protein n=1 Tax=Adineta steineri TaxID=433720 RepID=A0A814ZE46_9BILA|nr:unnamed protein product [Adineta steineri]CAF1242381.1 unnamed protein product [Adineta steineri]